MKQNGEKPKMLHLNGTLGWGLAALAAVVCGIGVVYYWRVFYGFDAAAPVCEKLRRPRRVCCVFVRLVFLLCQSAHAGAG